MGIAGREKKLKSYKLLKNRQGFTLIEIIVVLVIIGIVMTLAVPAVMKYINEAAETKAKSQARAAYFAAQTITLDMIKENPGVSTQVIMKKINNADVINKELGIERTGGKLPSGAGAVNQITCSVKEQNNSIEGCIIDLLDYSDDYLVSLNEITKYNH